MTLPNPERASLHGCCVRLASPASRVEARHRHQLISSTTSSSSMPSDLIKLFESDPIISCITLYYTCQSDVFLVRTRVRPHAAPMKPRICPHQVTSTSSGDSRIAVTCYPVHTSKHINRGPRTQRLTQSDGDQSINGLVSREKVQDTSVLPPKLWVC